MAQTEQLRTSIELAGARKYAGCLDVQSPEKRAISSEGLFAGWRVWTSSLLGLPAEQARRGLQHGSDPPDPTG